MEVRAQGLSVRDEIRQGLYDTVTISNASSIQEEKRFFSNREGKTLTETNMRQNGSLERGKSLRVTGLQIDAQNSDSAKKNLLAFYQELSYFQFQIAEKVYLEGPLRHLTGKIDYHSAVAGATDVADHFVQYGSAGNNPVGFNGDHVLDIAPLTSFFLLWKVEGASAGQITAMTPSIDAPIRFVATLKGIIRRLVQ